jgi:hypothetical protein
MLPEPAREMIASALAAHPWLLPLAITSFVIWLCAAIVVIRSRKFLRKLLWLLLSLVSFSFSWSEGPVSISAGLPIGALYILGFWLFGPAPTPEQIEAARKRAEPKQASLRQVVALRFAYGAAVVAALLMGYIFVSGRFLDAFGDGVFPLEMFQAMRPLMIGTIALLAAVLVLLVARPYFWGKLIAFWAGLSWTGFSAASTLITGWSNTVSMTLAAGITMLAVGIIHQIIDPRWSGPPLRAT